MKIKKTLRDARAAVRGQRDWHRLTRRHPDLATLEESAAGELASVRPLYDEYVASVSVENVAASAELAGLLLALCSHYQPRVVADLGSGLSSALLRVYASRRDEETIVYSVDDDDAWLEKTRAFLAAHELPDDRLMTWETFTREELPPFDLILHDMGNLATRLDTLPRVLDLAGEQGIVILDDMHKPHYDPGARALVNRKGRTYYSLRRMTQDRHGRYCGLVMPRVLPGPSP